MSLKISLKRITMNGIAVYLPVLVLNFNLYGIACTVGTPRLKTCFLCGRNLLDHTAQEVLQDVHKTLQTWHNYLQGGHQELH